jgi:hypothetical protein
VVYLVDDSITGNLRTSGRTQMSAPPEANSEYSRGSGPSGRITGRRWEGATPPVFDSPPAGSEREPEGRSEQPEQRGGVTATVLLIAACVGALLILVSQFATLYQLHSATSSVAVKSVGTGSNHAWAPIPLALLAVLLAVAAYRSGSRVALAAIAVLGVVTLLIALIGDLPDAHATGLIGSGASQYSVGTSTPSAGLYLETLGAVVLLITGGVGLLLLGLPGRSPKTSPSPTKAA